MLPSRDYWSDRTGYPTEHIVNDAIIEQIITSTYNKYKNHCIRDKVYLINGGIVELGSGWMRLTHETQEGLEELAKHLKLPKARTTTNLSS